MRMISRSFFLVMFVLAAAPAWAQNGSTAGSLELYSTFHAIGARLSYTGDANANATARLEWRPQGSGTWTRGVQMTRITNSRWAGSVLWLQPDSPYEVRAIIEDPDGGGSTAGSTTTRRNLPDTPTGRTWWVATTGNDANAGSQSSPFATLQTAAGRCAAGDQIRMKPGIYYQSMNTPVSGTASAPIHLIADGPGVVLDGSDPAYLHRTDWVSEGGGVYSVAYSPTTQRVVCADSVQRLYFHASLSDLQTNAAGVAQGFTITGGRLYVKLEDGTSPNAHTMHIAKINAGLTIDGSYWHVQGLELRYFGNATYGCGIELTGGTGSWVENNYVHTFGHRGIYIHSGSTNNLVEKNYVRDGRISSWPWAATKSHQEEVTGISNRGGRGNVIRMNTVRGTFDGLDANAGDADENIAADADYYQNSIIYCGDDAIETDTVSGINLRLWSNTFDNNFSGISMAPIYQGPEYFLYNSITNLRGRGGFKFSISSVGQAWICHNTVYTTASGHPAVWPSGPYSNMHFRNNILGGVGIPAVNDDAGESQTGNDFDGDLVYSTSGAFFRWKGVNYSTLSALRSGTNFEQNGRNGNPLFAGAPTGDFSLLLGSPAIDGAIRLEGINDVFFGAGPDIGRFESGPSGPDVIRPAPITDLR